MQDPQSVSENGVEEHSADLSVMSGEGLLAQGERMRRRVLGDEHVDRSMANADPFTLPMQEMITKYCWGDIWNRPQLELKTRSLINIGMLTAMSQSHELSVHVKGAIRNGCTPEEIREVVLQATIYAGAPAGLSAMRTVTQTLKDIGQL